MIEHLRVALVYFSHHPGSAGRFFTINFLPIKDLVFASSSGVDFTKG